MDKKMCFNQLQLKLLIILTIFINFSGVFHPLVRNDDPLLYANIAKHIVLTNDWLNLKFNQADWLDKPHFLFWVTAISFKIFGINSFAYILPGFLFHILGAYYTYLLAKTLYNNPDVGLIAALLYLTSLHLLISALDVRAEAYLLGEIMGAAYYWYQYDRSYKFSVKYLVLGSVFTAMAIMTKGIFVIITIMSGLIFVWAYTKQLSNLIKLKWLFALMLSLLFILPEIYALYWQFDLHPEKLVFGRYNVSGVKWFFWDSQFGRFFNSGPITVNHVQNYHYLFFLHTFLWSFLPWSALLIYASIRYSRLLYGSKLALEKIRICYLFGSFIPTFILFSCTKFQLDHYTNIIIPFAAILCAGFIYEAAMGEYKIAGWLLYLQVWLAYTLAFAAVILSVFIFGNKWLILIVGVGLFMLVLFILFMHKDELTKAYLYPTLAINLVFLFMLQINEVNAKYDVGYQISRYINHQIQHSVVDYNVDSLTLEFYTNPNTIY
ncbi:MAG: glycosyltransferase family 39 protein, partial [Burkholderiales bacterium]|nr:glycosyltransferase family 39 protein [Burkholderiales bacterium]